MLGSKLQSISLQFVGLNKAVFKHDFPMQVTKRWRTFVDMIDRFWNTNNQNKEKSAFWFPSLFCNHEQTNWTKWPFTFSPLRNTYAHRIEMGCNLWADISVHERQSELKYKSSGKNTLSDRWVSKELSKALRTMRRNICFNSAYVDDRIMWIIFNFCLCVFYRWQNRYC